MEKIKLEFFWVAVTKEQTKEALRLLAIFDGWRDKKISGSWKGQSKRTDAAEAEEMVCRAWDSGGRQLERWEGMNTREGLSLGGRGGVMWEHEGQV